LAEEKLGQTLQATAWFTRRVCAWSTDHADRDQVNADAGVIARAAITNPVHHAPALFNSLVRRGRGRSGLAGLLEMQAPAAREFHLCRELC
jgi:hypothetical protein